MSRGRLRRNGIIIKRGDGILSPKNRLHMRIEEQLDAEIEELSRMYEEKTGIKTTKTNIIESALREGLKVLRKNLK